MNNQPKLNDGQLRIICDEIINVSLPIITNELKLDLSILTFVLDGSRLESTFKRKMPLGIYTYGRIKDIIRGSSYNDTKEIFISNNMHRITLYYNRMYRHHSGDKLLFIIKFIREFAYKYFLFYFACNDLGMYVNNKYDNRIVNRNPLRYYYYKNNTSTVEEEARAYSIYFIQKYICPILNNLIYKNIIIQSEAATLYNKAMFLR